MHRHLFKGADAEERQAICPNPDSRRADTDAFAMIPLVEPVQLYIVFQLPSIENSFLCIQTSRVYNNQNRAISTPTNKMAIAPHIEERSTLNASPPSQPQTHIPTPPNGEKPRVMLIPFDPESEEQSERLRLTRVACGWKADKVPLWREKQSSGDMSIHWVVSILYFVHSCRRCFIVP